MNKIIFKKPYIYYFIIIFFVYLTLNIIFSQFYITIRYIPKYLETINWFELLTSLIFSLIIAFLVSLTVLTSYLKYKERKNIKKGVALSAIGTTSGFAAGICTACVAGLFPFIFSLFGISFSWLSLPFKGLEFQLLVIIILLLSLYFLNKKPKNLNQKLFKS